MLKQFLTADEYNQHFETILATTQATPYHPATSQDFLHGLTSGTMGPADKSEPTYFVANRVMDPQTYVSNRITCPPLKLPLTYYTPFTVSVSGTSQQPRSTICVNLGNSLPTHQPGQTPWTAELGVLSLVAFVDGVTTKLTDIATSSGSTKLDESFIKDQAGFFSTTVDGDYANTPLGIVGDQGGQQTVLLAENLQGYYLRADKLVFRMNPECPEKDDPSRGNTSVFTIHALKFGQPVPDGTKIVVTLLTPEQALEYTSQTAGTGGVNGLADISIPPNALTINQQEHPPAWDEPYSVTVETKDGAAVFDMKCSDPQHPRPHVDGQVYFLRYGFADPAIADSYKQDSNDLISVLVYDATVPESTTAVDILGKYGRIYKIMNFLADEQKISEITRRNAIKVLLEKPVAELQHMPVTRDLSAAARQKVIDWIDSFNSQ